MPNYRHSEVIPDRRGFEHGVEKKLEKINYCIVITKFNLVVDIKTKKKNILRLNTMDQ